MGESRKAFDFSRGNIFLADPSDLCIVDGALYLTGDELGPLDGRIASHALADAARLREPLDAAFVANVNALGVLESIVISKLDVDGQMLPVVVEGRTRVRAARVANAQRKRDGLPPITIKADNRKASAAHLLAMMVAGNVHRAEGPIEKIAKLHALKNHGVESIEDQAVYFGVSASTIKAWWKFDENASDKTRAAVEDGHLSITAASIIARKPHEDQDAQLAEHEGGRVSVSKVRVKAAGGRQAAEAERGPGRAHLRRVLGDALDLLDTVATDGIGDEQSFRERVSEIRKASEA